jgi:hypothetical protein
LSIYVSKIFSLEHTYSLPSRDPFLTLLIWFLDVLDPLDLDRVKSESSVLGLHLTPLKQPEILRQVPEADHDDIPTQNYSEHRLTRRA